MRRQLVAAARGRGRCASTATSRTTSVDRCGPRRVAAPRPTTRTPRPIVVPLCRNDAQLDAVLDAGATRGRARLDGARRARDARSSARAHAARGSASRPCASRSPARRRSTRTSRGSSPTPCSSAAGARSRTSTELPARRGRAARRLLAQRHQLDHRRLGARPRASTRHRRARSRSRAAARAARPRRRAGRVAVTVHHHIPTFHTEHCVYAHLLSTGRDYRTCGRPCEQHEVALRDRVGLVHPVDRRCRLPQHRVQRAGAERGDARARAARARRAALPGRARARDRRRDAARATRRTRSSSPARSRPPRSSARPRVHEQFGVTGGTMRTLAVLK